MMKININNYEEFFLDFMEGNLSPEDAEALELFLSQNPEQKTLLENMELVQLDADSTEFDKKSSLKKTPADLIPDRFNDHEDFFIAKIDGELSIQEEGNFDLYLKSNPHLEKDYRLFQQSRLVPDYSVTFKNKETLKKHVLVANYYRRYFYMAASAAAVLLVFVVFILSHKSNTPAGRQPELVKNILPIENQLNTQNKSKSQITPGSTEKQITKEISNEQKVNYDAVVHENIQQPENNFIYLASFDINKLKNTINSELSGFPVTIYPIKYYNSDDGSSDQLSWQLVRNNNYIAVSEKTDAVVLNQNSLAVSEKTVPPDKLNTPAEFMIKKLKNNVLKVNQVNNEPDLITFWDFAEATVKRFNKIMGRDIRLNQEYDSHGHVVRLAINSNAFEFSTPVRKK